MTRKNSKGAARPTQPAKAQASQPVKWELRAQSIIEDLRRDIDVRYPIAQLLERVRRTHDPSDEKEMLDLIKAAERGDTSHIDRELDEIDDNAVERARMVLALIDEGSPGFIFQALITALSELEKGKGVQLWRFTGSEDELESGGYSLIATARALERYRELEIMFERKHDLAACIAGVLQDRDTPHDLYNAMGDELASLTSARIVTESPEVIRLALQAQKERTR